MASPCIMVTSTASLEKRITDCSLPAKPRHQLTAVIFEYASEQLKRIDRISLGTSARLMSDRRAKRHVGFSLTSLRFSDLPDIPEGMVGRRAPLYSASRMKEETCCSYAYRRSLSDPLDLCVLRRTDGHWFWEFHVDEQHNTANSGR